MIGVQQALVHRRLRLHEMHAAGNHVPLKDGEDVRKFLPQARVAPGGVIAQQEQPHARTLAAPGRAPSFFNRALQLDPSRQRAHVVFHGVAELFVQALRRLFVRHGAAVKHRPVFPFVHLAQHVLLLLFLPRKDLLQEIVRRIVDEYVPNIEDHVVAAVPRHGLICLVKTDASFHNRPPSSVVLNSCRYDTTDWLNMHEKRELPRRKPSLGNVVFTPSASCWLPPACRFLHAQRPLPARSCSHTV